jgi:thioesterase domain-containing protein
VSALFVTSALFNVLARDAPDAFASVKHLLVGGDAVDPHAVREVLRAGGPARLLNAYGPTETTTFATSQEVQAVPEGVTTIPIGRPIGHTRVYVLDERFNLVPVGVAGELFIGGAGLAWGYWNRPDLTAAQFVPDPFGIPPGGRLYRTGDRVRWRADGVLEFLGRLDEQIKIRGFRIEPGEIEFALNEHQGVRESVVVAREEAGGDRRLVGYIVAAGEAPQSHALRTFLAARLPAQAIPAVFVFMDALPLTSNGKVDRRALPAPQPAAAAGGAAQGPRDGFERQLLSIWERVLGLSGLRVTDNFFEVGGHSLLAVRLFSEIEKAWGRNLPLATLFEAPTVDQLASVLRQTGWIEPWVPLVALQPEGRKPPLFLVHAVGGNLLTYHSLARRLAPEQPVYGLQAVGLDGSRTPYTRIEDMAAHYLNDIRTVQPRGPYHVGGASFGGVVAFEMARQLSARGESAGLVALLDSSPPAPRTATRAVRVRNFGWRAAQHAHNFLALAPREQLSYIAARTKTMRRRIRTRLWQLVYKAYRRRAQPLPPALQSVAQAAFLAFREYQPGLYPGRVTLFRARERGITLSNDRTSGWGRWAAGGVEVHDVPGDHLTMLAEPHVGLLVERLQECLDQAAAQRTAIRSEAQSRCPSEVGVLG